jgi:isoaspartyl peptidase/L-asparaginase-like protein (Ntn-hydrolase superfamily)
MGTCRTIMQKTRALLIVSSRAQQLALWPSLPLNLQHRNRQGREKVQRPEGRPYVRRFDAPRTNHQKLHRQPA